MFNSVPQACLSQGGDPVFRRRPIAIVAANEFGRLLESRPRYIVKMQGRVGYLRGWPEEAELTAALAAHYSLWRTTGVVEIYRRN